MGIPASAQKEDRVVFTSASQDYCVRDVIDAAHFRGELDPFWNELLVRLAAETLAHETEAELDEAALDEASIAFRYRYDLITAEETEQWLDARHVTLGDFSEYFAREQWAKAFRGKTNPEIIPLAEASSEQRERLAVELTLTGELDRMATQLAWRVAVCDNERAAEVEHAWLEAERTGFAERVGGGRDEVAAWLHGLGREASWLEENLAIEAAYRRQCEKLLTKEAREREVSALRLPLTRLDMEMIELESRN